MKSLLLLIFIFGLVLGSIGTTPVLAATLTITPASLPTAYVNELYSVQLTSNSRYPQYVVWTIIGGSLPPGLRLEKTGVIHGTPTTEGSYSFTVRADETVPDSTFGQKSYTLRVSGRPRGPAPPPQSPMEFSLSVDPLWMWLDPTPIATGRREAVFNSATLDVRKTGGDLTQYVTITVEGAPAGMAVLIETSGGIPPFSTRIQFQISDRWRELQGRTYFIRIIGRTEVRTKFRDYRVEVLRAALPDLQLVSFAAITQAGVELVKNKETQFAFEYTQRSPLPPIEAWVRLSLPKSEWDHGVPPAYRPEAKLAAVGVEFSDEGGAYHFRRRFVFLATTDPREKFFFPDVEGTFYPKPKLNTASLRLTLDPGNEIREGDETNNEGSFRLQVRWEASRLNLAWVLFQWERWRFSDTEIREAENFRSAAHQYLPAIFPIKDLSLGSLRRHFPRSGIFNIYETDELDKDDLYDFAWEADSIAEEAAEAGYHRVVAIMPEGLLQDRLSGAFGVVASVSSLGLWGGDAPRVAFVNLRHATGSSDNYKYIPLVAHELSHTFGFPDIYDGCSRTPRVYHRWAYFNKVRGGIEAIGDPADQNRNYDIMACVFEGVPGSGYWSAASYKAVHDGLRQFGDPPEGLLISLRIHKDGKVTVRPFQKLVNHPFPFPNTEGTGNFYLVLLDKGGKVIRRYPQNIAFSVFVDPGGEKPVDSVPLIVVVEYFDDLGAIELRDAAGKVWMRKEVSAHKPDLLVIQPTAKKKLARGRTYTFEWRGTDKDGDEIWYSALIGKKGEEVWSSLAHYLKETAVKFPVPEDAEVGDYHFKVIATDGINTDIEVVEVSIVEKIREYTLEVSSNVGITIQGSGIYEENDTVKLIAPQSEKMPGVLGFLGGKYRFDKWRGAVTSTSREVEVAITGDLEKISVQAIYKKDYWLILLIALGIAVVAGALFLGLRLRRKAGNGD